MNRSWALGEDEQVMGFGGHVMVGHGGRLGSCLKVLSRLVMSCLVTMGFGLERVGGFLSLSSSSFPRCVFS